MSNEKTLHADVGKGYKVNWLEHEVSFVFTKRIKYEMYEGDFYRVLFEVEFGSEKRYWRTFWKMTPIIVTKWIPEHLFEYKHAFKKPWETKIYNCAEDIDQ